MKARAGTSRALSSATVCVESPASVYLLGAALLILYAIALLPALGALW